MENWVKNPKILRAQVTFYGKKGFSKPHLAKRVKIQLPWMKKGKIFPLDIKGRKTKKIVEDKVQRIIHDLEVEKSKTYDKRLSRRLEKREPYKRVNKQTLLDLDEFEKEKIVYSKFNQSHILSNTKIYSYRKKILVTEKNYKKLFSALYGVIEYAAQSWVFEKSGYGHQFMIKLYFDGRYERYGKVKELGYSLQRITIEDPDDVRESVKFVIKSFMKDLNYGKASYFMLQLLQDDYYLLGFNIEVVKKVKPNGIPFI